MAIKRGPSSDSSANGAGKTTLLRTITGQLAPLAGEVRLAVTARLLPQRLDVLDGALTVADNVARFAPEASPDVIRARPGADAVPGRARGPGGGHAIGRGTVPRQPPSPHCCWPSRRPVADAGRADEQPRHAKHPPAD